MVSLNSTHVDLQHTPFLPYNYVPSETVGIIFVVLYSISAAIHTWQAIRYKQGWLYFTTVFCGALEIIGWAARLWSSQAPYLIMPFEMQVTCTVLAPTPLVAANFIILGFIINTLGTCYSRIRPQIYTIAFCCADLISLCVQAIGGAHASWAINHFQDAEIGAHVMLSGIVFQMLVMILYVYCATEFFIRYFRDAPFRPEERGQRVLMDRNMKTMVGALIFTTLCLFVRSVYRTIELSDGWTGRIIATQLYFNVMDGAMVTLSIYAMNLLHPGRLLSLPEERIPDWLIPDRFKKQTSPVVSEDSSADEKA